MQGKGKLLLLLGLFVLLVALIVTIIVVQLRQSEDPTATATETTKIYLNQAPIASFATLSYTYEGNTYHFVNDNGMWISPDPAKADYPWNQATLVKMLSALSSLQAERVVEENCTDFSEYGLVNPAITVTARIGETETTFCIGRRYFMEESYYCRVAGKSTVYMIGQKAVEAFQKDLDDLTVHDFRPYLSEQALLTELSLKRPGAEAVVYDAATKKTELDAAYAQYERTVLFDTFENWCLPEDPTAALAALGLDAASRTELTVTLKRSAEENAQTVSSTFYFGGRTQDGEQTYLQLKDSRKVYRIPTSELDALLALF